MRFSGLLLGLTLCVTPAVSAQDLNPADVQITLEAALPIALETASKQFPDLDKYLLYSVTPRVLKGDRRGLHWQFNWQEKAFPHRRLLLLRVYMKDGSTYGERLQTSATQSSQRFLVREGVTKRPSSWRRTG